VTQRGVLSGAVLALVAGIVIFVVTRGPEGSGPQDRSRRTREERFRETLFTVLRPVALSNCTLERFGEPHDGGYLMCANLLDGVQAGYSYGISGYDQWGCDISRKLDVRVHQYDCFDTRQPACPGGDMIFHAECVGAAASTDEDGRPFDTIANQIVENGDSGKRLAAKVDVEGAEWDSFLFAPDSVFEQIDQLAVEFHGVDEERFVAVAQRLLKFFHVAHVHFNNYSCNPGLKPFPASAYEVLFVSKKLGEPDPSARVALPHPDDAPNNPDLPDCQAEY
jgi:hypothetical protein